MNFSKYILALSIVGSTFLDTALCDIKEVLPKDNLVIRYKNFHESEIFKNKPYLSTDIVQWHGSQRFSVASKDEVIKEQSTAYFWLENDNVHAVNSFKDLTKNYLFKGPLNLNYSWLDNDGIRMTVMAVDKEITINDIVFRGCTIISVLFSENPNDLVYWTEIYSPDVGLIKRSADGKVLKEILSYHQLSEDQ